MRAAEGPVYRDLFSTSWGWAGVVWSDRGLRCLVLPRPARREAAHALAEAAGSGARPRPWPLLRRQLEEYLEGKRRVFSVALDLPEARGFTRRVRDCVRALPYGRTMTYGEVADRVGSPGGARAVGQVMRRNPVPLFIPCHRVVAAGGIGGFSGGISKSRLLALEAGLGGEETKESRGARKGRGR